jgi:hypothetical protein
MSQNLTDELAGAVVQHVLWLGALLVAVRFL